MSLDDLDEFQHLAFQHLIPFSQGLIPEFFFHQLFLVEFSSSQFSVFLEKFGLRHPVLFHDLLKHQLIVPDFLLMFISGVDLSLICEICSTVVLDLTSLLSLLMLGFNSNIALLLVPHVATVERRLMQTHMRSPENQRGCRVLTQRYITKAVTIRLSPQLEWSVLLLARRWRWAGLLLDLVADIASGLLLWGANFSTVPLRVGGFDRILICELVHDYLELLLLLFDLLDEAEGVHDLFKINKSKNMFWIAVMVYVCAAEVHEHQAVSFTDSPLQQVLWCEESKSQYLALTEKGSVYRVRNDIWENLEENFIKKALVLTEDMAALGVVYVMHPNLVDPQTVIFQGTKKVFWISQDCGESVTAVNPENYLSNFQFHPSQAEYVISTELVRCTEDDCREYQNLLLSNDFGVTWRMIQSYVNTAQWVTRNHLYGLIVTFDPQGHGNQSFAGWTMDYVSINHQSLQQNLFYSDNFLENRTTILEQCSGFRQTTHFLFMAKYDRSNGSDLFAADYDTLKAVKLEMNLPPVKHNFKVLDAQPDRVQFEIPVEIFVAITELDSEYAATVYASNRINENFTQSLDYLTSTSSFLRIPHLHDIFIANVHPPAVGDHYRDALKYYQEQGFLHRKEVDNAIDDLKQRIMTKMSFDVGTNWTGIEHPDCGIMPGCALHLHITATAEIPPIYMPKKTPGLIIANGNIGQFLSFDPDIVKTFLSQDAGKTWVSIADHPSIYEVFPYGDFIILASFKSLAKKLYFMVNRQMDLEEINLEVPIRIKNIINFQKKFIVYGLTADDNGLTIKIDLTNTTYRRCVKPLEAGQMTSDFQYLNITTASCINGHNRQFVVRKPEAHCLVNDFNQSIIVDKCQCTIEDYDCADGFERQGNECVGVKEQGTCDVASQYKVLSGYRKRVGNLCENGLQYNDSIVKCGGIRWYIKLIGILVTLYLLIVLRRNYLREKAEAQLRVEAQKSRIIFDDEDDDLKV